MTIGFDYGLAWVAHWTSRGSTTSATRPGKPLPPTGGTIVLLARAPDLWICVGKENGKGRTAEARTQGYPRGRRASLLGALTVGSCPRG